jgi:PTS system N-acetylglucosamine-specific IIA component
MTTLPSSSANVPPRSAKPPKLLVGAPVAGTAIPLSQVPDPVFAARMVGPGAAVDPSRVRQHALAPFAGRLVKLKPHAFVVGRDDGRHVLVHLGIDTVGLREGFECLVAEGAELASGTPVVTWDPGAIAACGLSPICAVVALDTPASAITVVAGHTARAVAAGEPLFQWT